jgi:hypothetical protein
MRERDSLTRRRDWARAILDAQPASRSADGPLTPREQRFWGFCGWAGGFVAAMVIIGRWLT